MGPKNWGNWEPSVFRKTFLLHGLISAHGTWFLPPKSLCCKEIYGQHEDPVLSLVAHLPSEKDFLKGLLKLDKIVLWFYIFILMVIRQMTTHWAWSKGFSLSFLTNNSGHYLDISRAVSALCLKAGSFNCLNSPGPQTWHLSLWDRKQSGCPWKGSGGILTPSIALLGPKL